MSAATALMIACWAILLLGAWRLARNRALRAREHAVRPDTLQSAFIEYAEQEFYIEHPFRLVAKIDRAYRTPDGLVLTELKRRKRTRTYPSDVVQLSVQKLAIERATEQPVSPLAYVVLEQPATRLRTSVAVQLLREVDVVRLAMRYRQVLRGADAPRKADLMPLCRSCTYARQCDPEVLRGGRN